MKLGYWSLSWVAGLLMAQVSFAATAQTPELQLVEGLFAATALDVQTPSGRQAYQDQIRQSVLAYASQHSPNPQVAARNFADAFSTLGISSQEVSSIQSVSDRYGQLYAQQNAAGTMTPERNQLFWHQYGTDLQQALDTIPYPEGAQYSGCQWSVGLMIGGLAVGIPILAYTIGKAMGDQNVSPWIANPGAIAFLVGIGGMIATIPTCLF